MKAMILQPVKAIMLIAIIFTVEITAIAQQHVIADKDNTHPEQSQQQYSVARIFLLNAVQMNGYNEIRWSATNEQDTRRYIVEYSHDGVNYQSAGEIMPSKGSYFLKHQILDPRTFMYRVRIEKKDGRFAYTNSILMEGAKVPAVLLYPTLVEGNTVNLRLDVPVERLVVIATDGREIFSKQMGGIIGSTQVVIPPISRGTYFMVFYGAGWRTTERFVVGTRF